MFVFQVKTGEKEPPTILEPLKSETVREGDTVVLTTQIVGTPTPKITWLKNGKPLTKMSTRTDGDTHILTIMNPVPGDTGEYTVTAKNDHGTAQTTATLIVEGKLEEKLMIMPNSLLTLSLQQSWKSIMVKVIIMNYLLNSLQSQRESLRKI